VREDGVRYFIYGSAKPLFDEEGRVRRTFSAFVDVTERKRAEKALEESMQALRNANEELQQFAYAASHDLQEPLRSIGSYAQLLQRRYADDVEASEYAGFMVDGVARMNTLIHDLLVYSRVGSGTLRRRPANLGNALQWGLLNLERSIKEHKATVTYDALPELIGLATQRVVGQRTHRGCLRVDLGDEALQGLQLLAFTGPEDAIEDAHAGKEPTGGLRWVLATAASSTWATPAASRASAAPCSVAPVVTTSSTSSTVRP